MAEPIKMLHCGRLVWAQGTLLLDQGPDLPKEVVHLTGYTCKLNLDDCKAYV